MNCKVAFLYMNNRCRVRKITLRSKLSKFLMLVEVEEDVLHGVVVEEHRVRPLWNTISVTR
jgi:hypothetical protein